MAGLQPGMGGVVVKDAQIHAPVLQTLQDGRVGGGLQPDGQPRRLLHQREKRGRQWQGKAARTGDAHLALIGVVGLQRLHQATFFLLSGQGQLLHRFAGLGQGKTLALLDNQRLADLCLRLAQMLRHARLRHAKASGRLGEMARLTQGRKGVKPARIQHHSVPL